jgi:hypothetical protein
MTYATRVAANVRMRKTAASAMTRVAGVSTSPLSTISEDSDPGESGTAVTAPPTFEETENDKLKCMSYKH